MKVRQLTFDNLGLDKPILNTLRSQGYEQPTPIQTQAIPVILEGRDVVGLAQTGTGKTAAFTLPLLQRLTRSNNKVKPGSVRILILSPTRELAAQIHKSVRDYGRNLSLKSACVVGGVAVRPQRKALERGVDVLVATPGRLEDLVQQRAVRLGAVETIVLDEADQMLDIGFMPAIRRILGLLPDRRQTLLFSATMPKEIRELSEHHLHKPAKISVTPVASTAEKVEQNVMHLPHDHKMIAITKLIGAQKPDERIIVFTRTKRGADKVARRLTAEGFGAAAIHGNKTQGQRQRALDGFRKGATPVLIATDIAARGIDVPGVGLVINFELPNIPESYVHRIGRTARAGASGVAVSFCARDERSYLRDIERLIRRKVNVLPTPEFDAGEVRKFASKAPSKKARFSDPRDKRKRRPGDRTGKPKVHSAKPGSPSNAEWSPTSQGDEKPVRRRGPNGAGKSEWTSKSGNAKRPAKGGKQAGAGTAEWRSKSDGDGRPARGCKSPPSRKPNRSGAKNAGAAKHRGKSPRRSPSRSADGRQAAAAH